MDFPPSDEQEHTLVCTSPPSTHRTCAQITLFANSAVNENTPGALQSFVIGQNGALTGPISTINSQGGSPAFTTALSTGEVAIMNVRYKLSLAPAPRLTEWPQYNTGNGMIIPTTTDPLHFSSAASLITFPAGVSHPHMAVQHNGEILVPDLVRYGISVR